MDFFQHQERARRKTGLLVLYFFLAVVAILVCVNLALLLAFAWMDVQLPPSQWLTHPMTLGISLFTLLVMVCGCLFKTWKLRRGGKGLAAMLGARPIDPDTRHSDEKKLINVVEEMSIASGIPAPQLYVLDKEEAINAFVAGFRPSETVLVVTHGTLKKLDRDELQGVIAHEFSHIFNADMRLNLRLIAVLAGILALGKIGEFMLRGSSRRSSSNRKGNSLVLVALALVVVGYLGLFFGRLIKAAISRQRELLADASAVQFTRNPAGLAGALIKIRNGNGSHLDSVHAEDMSHMCFGETLGFRFRNLLATHPPLDERLGALGSDWVARARTRARSAGQPDVSPSASVPEGVAAFSGGSDASSSVSERSGPATSSRVGTVSEADVGYARSLLEAIPADLHKKLHNPVQAELALYALIISSSDSDRQSLLKSAGMSEHLSALQPLSQQLSELGSRLRLPIIDLALPTLKGQPSAQRREILERLATLTRADQRTTLFEWALVALARQQLDDHARRNRHTRFHRYRAVTGELQLAFSVMTWASGARDEQARALFRQASHGLLPEARTLLPLSQCSSQRLGQALDRLADLSPLLKGPVIDGLADLVLTDGKVQVSEAEMLRAMAALMECPLPPLFAGNQNR
ncbi:MAG: protease [Alcanivorax sp.]|jgi:Zn-dependent protease with chaperone function|uniref:M48 family metallopeptidase n=1 Tax=Alcanivorax TaxID=59753 RepID=UPI000C51F284|nr:MULTISPECIES: M48 family metallopeptidase [Alcanivorax]MAC13458.1 protease [Alcanivorax sp.]MAC16610.1 protease [Alcanivorax sp.]MBG31902.1 protease [Alcanivorax sp.]MDF1639203.1 M48 family metallopeptidase [Alcanivorax jadensis]|tara:strand:+ start:1965 stop:3872 length:1908 start_codon:yes stop_codon:yes gene_type:complete